MSPKKHCGGLKENMKSLDTTRSEEAKAEAVKKCTKLALKCLRICKVKKKPKKNSQQTPKTQ